MISAIHNTNTDNQKRDEGTESFLSSVEVVMMCVYHAGEGNDNTTSKDSKFNILQCI